MRTSITTCLAVLVAAVTAYARIINVPAEYPTIQAGIDGSVNGDTVLVAPGSYSEVFEMHGRNILLTSSHGPDTTFIRGNCGVTLGEDTTCVIRGFCFLPQEQPNPWALVGCLNGSSPKIEGNILMNNESSMGGGIWASGSNPVIRANIIKNNYASGIGGGIGMGDFGRPTLHAEISGNIITNNRTGFTNFGEGAGGGLNVSGYAIIKHNLIYDNKAVETMYGGDGGGIYRNDYRGISGYRMVIENNTIVNNTAMTNGSHGRGGGLYFISDTSTDSLVIRNNIFAFNPWGGNVRGNPHDSMYLYWDYNLIFEDTSLGFPHGDHDIFLDPLFIDTLADDYHVLPDSPCIDAGDPASPRDPDSTRADIGAYYFDQSVGIDEDGAPTGPYQFSLRQNYPNPFNSQTIISYHLDEESTVSLFVFSITGHLVLPILNKEVQGVGEHSYTWEGRDANGKTVSTGIYFYELYVNGPAATTAGKYRESKAMILIK